MMKKLYSLSIFKLLYLIRMNVTILRTSTVPERIAERVSMQASRQRGINLYYKPYSNPLNRCTNFQLARTSLTSLRCDTVSFISNDLLLGRSYDRKLIAGTWSGLQWQDVHTNFHDNS
jgi:hypothetical protein